jgi:hypothetical protein
MVVPTLSRMVECESLLEAMPGYFYKFVCSLVLYLSFIVLPASATTAPAISPSTGVYSTAQAAATITADAGASIYYTLDGSTPTSSSTPYTAAIPLNSINTIKAIAILSGVSSTVTTANIQNDENSVLVARPGLSLWYKPEFITVSAGKVTRWSDLSGVAPSNDATQSTSANQPTFVSSALNAYAGLTFNGTNSYLTLPSALTNLSTGFTIFAVINPNTSSVGKTLFTASTTGVQDLVDVQTNGTGAVFDVNNGTSTSNLTTASGLTIGTFQTVDFTAGATLTPGATEYVNGALVGSGTVLGLNNVARPVSYIGANNALTSTSFWGGKIVEIIAYSRALTVSERASVEGYLASKYQTATSLATPLPLFNVATSTLSSPKYIALSSTPDATIYVTTNGSTPTTASPVYSGPINVYYTQTIKAIAVRNGVSSGVASVTLTLDSTQWPAPSATDTTVLQTNLQLPTIAIPQ